MDKLIIVIYIPRKCASRSKFRETLNHASQHFSKMDDEHKIHYVIGTNDGDTKIDCINPKLIGENEYEKVKVALDQAKSIIENLSEKNPELS